MVIYMISQAKATPLYPVRKPQHSCLPRPRSGPGPARQVCWGWWKYLQKQEPQLLIEGGVKTLPFLTGQTKMLQNAPPSGRG